VERTWQLESVPLQESASLLLTEQAQEAAAEHGRPRTGDTASAFLAMQRTVGNRAMQRLVAAMRGQEPRPSPVSEPHSETQTAGQECHCGGACASCQSPRWPAPTATPVRKPLGKPLMPALKEDMEGQFGEDFSGVRVHHDAWARQATQQLHADVLTTGHDIFFNAGQYDPTSYRGRRILAHELAHVVQQSRGWRPSSTAVSVGEPNDRYEREAGRVAEQVVHRAPQPSLDTWKGGKPKGGHVKIHERWRGPNILVSRLAPGASAGRKPVHRPGPGLTVAHMACLKRIYDTAMQTPKDVKWKCCYVTARAATCGLPRLLNMAVAQPILAEAIAPVDWEHYLADPRGLACQAQGGQSAEVCCEETHAQSVIQQRGSSQPPRR
jgi:hypothetical protein